MGENNLMHEIYEIWASIGPWTHLWITDHRGQKLFWIDPYDGTSGLGTQGILRSNLWVRIA